MNKKYHSKHIGIHLLALMLPVAVVDAQVPETIHYQGKVTVDGEPFNGTGSFKFALVDGEIHDASTATASASVLRGIVIHIQVHDSGSGYETAPEVSISGGGGSGAVATAVVEDGEVSAINIENAGSGYDDDSPPDVTIAEPVTMETFWSNDGSSSGGNEPSQAVELSVVNGVFSVNLGDLELDGMSEPITSDLFAEGSVFLRVWFDDGQDGFQLLSPDQPLASVPYALSADVAMTADVALSADVAVSAQIAEAVAEGAVSFDEIDPEIGLWSRHATTGAIEYFADDQGIRIEPFTDSTNQGGDWSPMITMGHASNVASSRGASVSGGGTEDFPNIADGIDATIGGGSGNFAGSSSFVGGGFSNEASGLSSTVGGGLYNIASGNNCTVAGGADNHASGTVTTIGGGGQNNASGTGSTIGGGSHNETGGQFATIPGGSFNEAFGNNSFAAGHRSKIQEFHHGSFVWADNTNEDFISTSQDQFLIRSSNGVGINTNAPEADLHVNGSVIIEAGLRIIPFNDPELSELNWSPMISMGSEDNEATDNGATISGGGSNFAPNVASNLFATVGGGVGNESSGQSATASGGAGNEASGDWSTVSGGAANTASATTSTVGGGRDNEASAIHATVSGGNENEASAENATISGGADNVASAHGATVGGGTFNTVNGLGATVPGGEMNEALGNHSFAAGRRAQVGGGHHGTFIWADSMDADFSSTDENQFLIRANGGVGIGTNSPDTPLHVMGNTSVGGFDEDYRLGVGTSNPWNTLHVVSNDAQGPVRVTVGNNNNSNTAMRIYPHGGMAIGNSWDDSNVPERGLRVHGDAMKPGGGSWSSPSDERLKKNVEPIPSGMLDHLLQLNGYTYEFKEEVVARDLALPGEQIGLIAQEVAEVFPDWVGEGDDGYLSVTERGVTAIFVEALRELRAEKKHSMNQQQAVIEEQEARIAELEARLASQSSLESRLTRLEGMLAGAELVSTSD